MKLLVACLALLIALPALSAQAAKAETTKAKEEKMGKIEGIVIDRPDGTFLGLTLMDGKYKLTFYSKMKKPVKVDVTRAIARWPNLHGPGDNRSVLNPAGDGTFLMAPQFVRPPYVFKLFLTLLKGEGDKAEAVETYTVDFHP